MLELTSRVLEINESATLAVTAEAARLKALGKDVIPLSAGEPDFTTPEHIIQAAFDAIRKGYTHYPPVQGYPELRKAIAEKLRNDNKLEYKPEEILVTVGAKQAIYVAAQAILNKDDEMLIPTPYWVSYPEIAKLCDAKPVYIQTYAKHNFAPTKDDLEKALTDKTRAIIYSSPSNPAGTIYTEQDLRVIADFALKNKLWIISDEIYEKLTFDGEHLSILNVAPELREQTILVNGFSKAYAMTGWRVGYLAATRGLVKAATNLQGHINTSVPAFVQIASITALQGDQAPLVDMCNAFKIRRDLMFKLVSELPGLTCSKPVGAFYVFADVSGWFNKTINGREIHNSSDFAIALLNDAQVAVVPGIAFGMDNFVRFSFATSESVIEKALYRIKNLLLNP